MTDPCYLKKMIKHTNVYFSTLSENRQNGFRSTYTYQLSYFEKKNRNCISVSYSYSEGNIFTKKGQRTLLMRHITLFMAMAFGRILEP